MKKLLRLLPHLIIILSIALLTLLIIDRVNSAMNFINNDLTKGMFFALIALGLACAGRLIFLDRKDK